MKKIIALICAISLCSNIVIVVNAEEIQPFATNIIVLETSIVRSGGCVVGEVTGAFTGSDCHALYYANIQYQSYSGDFINADNGSTFRGYTAGKTDTFLEYLCSPTPGVKYRFHVLMKVYDSNDILRDSDIINSLTLTY